MEGMWKSVYTETASPLCFIDGHINTLRKNKYGLFKYSMRWRKKCWAQNLENEFIIYCSATVVRWHNQASLPLDSNPFFLENTLTFGVLIGSLSVMVHQLSEHNEETEARRSYVACSRSRIGTQVLSPVLPDKAWCISIFSLMSSLECQFPASQGLERSWVLKPSSPPTSSWPLLRNPSNPSIKSKNTTAAEVFLPLQSSGMEIVQVIPIYENDSFLGIQMLHAFNNISHMSG